MREIKFRAWDKNTNTMYENISILPSMECIAINVDYDHDFQEYCIDESCVVELKDVELLEYTGLKDKNGVEIYEGDIVETTRALNHIVGVVTMIKGCWYIQDGKDSYYRLIPRFGVVENRVIGNVYENKELLEENYE